MFNKILGHIPLIIISTVSIKTIINSLYVKSIYFITFNLKEKFILIPVKRRRCKNQIVYKAHNSSFIIKINNIIKLLFHIPKSKQNSPTNVPKTGKGKLLNNSIKTKKLKIGITEDKPLKWLIS